MTAAPDEKSSILACPGSKLYVFYSAAENRESAKILLMELVIVLALYVLCRHSHLQNVGAEEE